MSRDLMQVVLDKISELEKRSKEIDVEMGCLELQLESLEDDKHFTESKLLTVKELLSEWEKEKGYALEGAKCP